MTAFDMLAESSPLQPNIWWLPPNFSTHGGAIDSLFTWIFWITMVTFVLVQIVLVVFLIKYRRKAGKQKAHFTHGNTRLEMAWTIAPAIILAVLAMASKEVWDNYRFYAPSESENPVEILVVGEQFKWNVVYPGPDGKLGRYLLFPKVTDPAYRTLPFEQALQQVNNHIQQTNPLGQVDDKHPQYNPATDAAYKDDDYVKAPGRPVVIPVHRPVHVVLGSKDVIHDFFLPNFRVKLDAVPGLRGSIWFTSTKQSTEMMSIDSAPADKYLWIDSATTGAAYSSVLKDHVIFDATDKRPARQRRIWLRSFDSLNSAANNRLRRANPQLQLDQITPEMTAAEVAVLRSDLKGLGMQQVSVMTMPFEIVCEELCGQGHFEMRGQLVVLSQDEFERFTTRAVPPPAPVASVE